MFYFILYKIFLWNYLKISQMAGNCPQYFRIFQEKDPRPSVLLYYLNNAESSCMLKHKSSWTASGLCPQLTLQIYLQYQEEGPTWGTNGEEIPFWDPFSSQSSSPHCRVMQRVSHRDSMTHLTSPPFLTCSRAHLFACLILRLLLPLSEHQPAL